MEKKKKITVKWQVCDGFCGGERVYSFHINEDDLYGLTTRREIEREIEQLVEQDFLDKVSYDIVDFDEILDKAEALAKIVNAEEE